MTRRPVDVPPPWRETPLDHWTADIDPAIMAGDEWASDDATEDPGAERIAEQEGGTVSDAPFMHPTIDTNYGLERDLFASKLPADDGEPL